MTRFELAASWSQTRRSSQTEPHPDVYNIISMKLSFLDLSRICFLSLKARVIILYGLPFVNTFFINFYIFFEKRCNSRKPAKMRVFRPSTTCIFLFFDYFQKNISKNISFPQSNIQVFSVTNTEFQFPALPLYTAPSPHNLVCGLPVSEKKGFPD